VGGGVDPSCSGKGGGTDKKTERKIRDLQSRVDDNTRFAEDAEKNPSSFPHPASVYRESADKMRGMIDELRNPRAEQGGLKKVDVFSDIKMGDMGRGAFIMPDNKLVDVTGDFGGGTNDHVGMFVTAEHPEEFGISKSLAAKITKEAEGGMAEFQNTMKGWNKVYGKGIIRVRDFDKGNVGFNFRTDKVSPNQVATHIEAGRIPHAAEYWFEADSSKTTPEFYGKATLRDLKNARDWGHLKQIQQDSSGSLMRQFHENTLNKKLQLISGAGIGN
jgi:hypothetical protein